MDVHSSSIAHVRTVLIWHPPIHVSICVDSLLSIATDYLDCLEIVQIPDLLLEVEVVNLLATCLGSCVNSVLHVTV